MKLIPVSTKVAVLPIDEEKISADNSGVREPGNNKERRACKGKVVAVGEDVKNDIKKGDIIYYQKFGPEVFCIEGTVYHIGDVLDFYCIIRD